MITPLSQLDTTITSFIFNLIPHTVLLDRLFSFLSLIGTSVILWIIIMMFLFIHQKNNRGKLLLYFTITFVVTIVLVNIVLKNISHRTRPSQLRNNTQNTALYICPVDYSFPSGHASAAFAGAVILAHFDPKRRFLFYIVAALISLSRIYLGCHFFLDVVAGGVIGAAISKFVLLYPKK